MLSKLLCQLYWSFKGRRARALIMKIIYRLEGGEFYSQTLRKIFKEFHGVEIGMYTHGGCFRAGNFDRHTTIGRYCSIAVTARAMNRNHPMDYKSTHGFFFNPALNYAPKDTVEYTPLAIGNDVWIGHNAIIMPNVRTVSNGAVIGAGAVVHNDVPPYGVVVGNPGRVVRYRFRKEVIEELLNSKWWEKSIEELKPNLEEFQKPYGEAQGK